MASRAVSLTFHSDDMSAERPWRASGVRVWRRKMGYFPIIFVIVNFSNNHNLLLSYINRAACGHTGFIQILTGPGGRKNGGVSTYYY